MRTNNHEYFDGLTDKVKKLIENNPIWSYMTFHQANKFDLKKYYEKIDTKEKIYKIVIKAV